MSCGPPSEAVGEAELQPPSLWWPRAALVASFHGSITPSLPLLSRGRPAPVSVSASLP